MSYLGNEKMLAYLPLNRQKVVNFHYSYETDGWLYAVSFAGNAYRFQGSTEIDYVFVSRGNIKNFKKRRVLPCKPTSVSVLIVEIPLGHALPVSVLPLSLLLFGKFGLQHKVGFFEHWLLTNDVSAVLVVRHVCALDN